MTRGAWLAGALGLALGLALAAGGLAAVAGALRDTERARAVGAIWAEQAADAFTEAGFGASGVDPADPLLAQRIVVVTESINERVARRVIESLLYLDRLDGAAPISLYLTTAGGWIDPAFAIVDTIGSLRAPVDTVAVGGCFSAGLVILAAGTGTRSATPNAVLSLHANSEAGGEPRSYERLARERFARHFERHAKLPREWLPLTGDRSYYLTPEEALAHGLIDRVASPGPRAPRGGP